MKQWWWTQHWLALGLLKNDFTELEKGGAISQCFLSFMWLVKALSPILPKSNIHFTAIRSSSRMNIFHFLQPVLKTIVQQASIRKSNSMLLFFWHFVFLLISKQNQNGVNNRLKTSWDQLHNFHTRVRVFAHTLYEQKHSHPLKSHLFLEILRQLLKD